jgi:hypothetical protein
LNDVLRERRRDELALRPQRRDELGGEGGEVAVRAQVGAALEVDVDAVEAEARDERVEVRDERALVAARPPARSRAVTRIDARRRQGPASASTKETMPKTGTILAVAAAARAAVGCKGVMRADLGPSGGATSGGAAGSTMTDPPFTGVGGTIIEGPVTGAAGSPPLDVGRISIHRLNNFEYDNTVHDLLGVHGMAQDTFQPDEQGEFDNDADAFTINDARFQAYFDAADAIGETVFADTALLQTYVYGLASPACTPSTTDTTCSSRIIAAFAQKAWRRPLSTSEVQDLVKLATDAIALGETADGSIKQVVKTLLASPPFLYRIELDANPTSLVAHELDPYELATRLSYLLFSSMPDDTLFGLAASGQVRFPAILEQQVERMLAAPEGAHFSESFAGQWLGVRNLQAHQVDPTVFPAFDEPLRAAFVQEELLYFNEFLTGPLSMRAFLTTPENFVNARLAMHYGFPPVDETAGFQKVTNGDPNRLGFMGLGGVLTATSFSYRTAPSYRGSWLLENLLCETIPVPPPSVPVLNPPAGPVPNPPDDVRSRLAAHARQADCAVCHVIFDPVGLGLENFDGIGLYRTKYDDGTPIDASGMLQTGETFSSLSQLAAILSSGAHQQELLDCASKKVMTYALSRMLTPADAPFLSQVRGAWAQQGYGLEALLKDVVTSPTFRYRRGEM